MASAMLWTCKPPGCFTLNATALGYAQVGSIAAVVASGEVPQDVFHALRLVVGARAVPSPLSFQPLWRDNEDERCASTRMSACGYVSSAG